MPPRKKTTTGTSSPTRSGKMASALAAAAKILGKPTEQWQVQLDSEMLKEPLPHIPTGSLIVDYLIGGEPNRFGVRPCPGLPRGRVTQIWGHESSGKCLPADTYISTPKGLLTVEEIFHNAGVDPVCVIRTVEKQFPLYNRQGEIEYTTHFTLNGRKPLYRVQTYSGAEITSTGNHPHLIMDENGFWSWKQARYICPGDVLVAARKTDFPNQECSFTYDEGYAVGLVVADSHMGKTKISITNDDPDIKQFITEHLPSILGVQPRQYQNTTGPVDYHFNSKEACVGFYNRFGLEAVNSPDKQLGLPVRCFSQEPMRGLLQGYFDCECSVDPERVTIEVTSASKKLLEQIKLLLSYFGVVSLLREKKVAQYPDNQYWRLSISGDEARRFIREVGTRSSKRRTQHAALLLVPCGGGSTNPDSIPNCGGLVRSLYGSEIRSREANHLCADYMGREPRARLTKGRLEQILGVLGDGSLVSERLREVAEADIYYYDPVISVEDVEPQPTFDFAMERTASFLANGFVTHNTTLALTAAATCISQGGTVLYVDWENDIVPDYAQALGVPISDPDKFVLIQPETLEEGIKIANVFAHGKVDLIIFDSVGAATPARIANRALEDVAEQSKVGELQAVWSQELNNLKRVINQSKTAILGISQTRAKISTGPSRGGPTTQPQGGNAWKFYSSIRLELRRVKSESTKLYNAISHKTDDRVVGAATLCKVIKCKLSKSQGREELFYILWGEGIDDLRSVLEIAIAHGVVKKGGAWFSWVDSKGEAQKFQGIRAFRTYLTENPSEFIVLRDSVLPYLGATSYTSEDMEDEDADVSALVQAVTGDEEDSDVDMSEMDID